jgi:hypothetical protein
MRAPSQAPLRHEELTEVIAFSAGGEAIRAR